MKNGHRKVLASGLACPPCNIGPGSTPQYANLAAQAVHKIAGGHTVFAGQRLEGFYVDLGAIFDLGDLRPFQNLHLGGMAAAHAVNATHDFSVHTIALKIPKHELTRDGSKPTDPMAGKSVIGVWTAASRRRAVVRHAGSGTVHEAGPWVQVSRLGNPLFNEVIVPLGDKDRWNALPAQADAQFLHYVEHPELAGLLPVLYPGVFPNLAKLTAPRADLAAILMTGIPAGIVPGFQNFTGQSGRSAAAEHGDPADAQEPQAARAGRGRPGRLPERPPRVRRRGHGGAAGDRRRDLSAREQELHAGRRRRARDRWAGAGSTRYLPHFPYLGTPKSGYEVKPLAA